jgi:hypothetical protein
VASDDQSRHLLYSDSGMEQLKERVKEITERITHVLMRL